jgi:hypothetical protein
MERSADHHPMFESSQYYRIVNAIEDYLKGMYYDFRSYPGKG